ncbi:Os06g0151401 [Oryza sativa Japonica Group]|uniref:Os06g0151401 protein n=1 Tax=Oryza sativa subsp. japonica TaxID=39947 RepID=A0A0P0WT56_ORYSJ|nr:Os06g0151401 [Oryza sativa Japonica Group]
MQKSKRGLTILQTAPFGLPPCTPSSFLLTSTLKKKKKEGGEGRRREEEAKPSWFEIRFQICPTNIYFKFTMAQETSVTGRLG